MTDIILDWLEQERMLIGLAIEAADEFPAGLYVERGIIDKLIETRRGELKAMENIQW